MHARVCARSCACAACAHAYMRTSASVCMSARVGMRPAYPRCTYPAPRAAGALLLALCCWRLLLATSSPPPALTTPLPSSRSRHRCRRSSDVPRSTHATWLFFLFPCSCFCSAPRQQWARALPRRSPARVPLATHPVWASRRGSARQKALPFRRLATSLWCNLSDIGPPPPLGTHPNLTGPARCRLRHWPVAISPALTV